MPDQLPPEVQAAVVSFIQERGEEALLMLLKAGHLFPSELGKLSQRALQHSADYSEDGLPHTLVIQVDPRAKEPVRRSQLTLTTGKPTLTLQP